jgi:hypothetical protein
MIAHRGVFALLASATLLAAAGVGCSLIVSGDVPDFQCTPGSAPTACPSGMTCSTSGQCVLDAGGIVEPIEAGDHEIPNADVVEAAAKADAPTGPVDNGQKCRVDGDCKSRLCASSTVLTTTITASTGPICTTPCCTSNECSAGFVCFNGGTGGGYCVPATLAQRSAPGGKLAGITCANSTECRSGLCTGSPTKTCIDTCCVEADCGGSSTCRVATVSAPAPAHEIWVCAPPVAGGTKLPGDSCASQTECRSQDCIPSGAAGLCRPACESTAGCRQVPGFETGHCLYGPSGSDFLKFCLATTAPSDSAAGTSCTDSSTCQSDYCDAELKKCANVCARDSDCLTSETCRPSGTGTPFLRCVAKP